ncbi:Claudin-8, partial [Ophiophagus hannah]
MAAATALQIVGLILGGIGTVGTFAITGMPQWRVTAFIENNVVVFETFWEGLWMNCIRQESIRMQCKVYDSLLALPPDLQASRGLMCAASALAFLAFAVAVLGMKCTQCTGNDDRIKGYILLAGGISFILTGIVVLIPVCFVAHNIIRDFYNPVITVAQKRELGEALYIGWASAFCLVAGGAILCCFCRCDEKTRSYRYSLPSQPTTYRSHNIQRRAESAYSKIQAMAWLLGIVGMFGTVIVTLMPQWKVSAFTGNNIIVFETIWEGLWMVCVSHIKNYQCEFYKSILALPPLLDAARALMCTACALSVLACLIALAGMKCVRSPGNNEKVKRNFLFTAGVSFFLAGVLVLIPVSCIANDIIEDFYNPEIQAARKRELGAALYLGWVSGAFLICGGGMFCGFCCCPEEPEIYQHSAPCSEIKPMAMRSY